LNRKSIILLPMRGKSTSYDKDFARYENPKNQPVFTKNG
jgi:hypothetical protein